MSRVKFRRALQSLAERVGGEAAVPEDLRGDSWPQGFTGVGADHGRPAVGMPRESVISVNAS